MGNSAARPDTQVTLHQEILSIQCFFLAIFQTPGSQWLVGVRLYPRLSVDRVRGRAWDATGVDR